jgi:hypothetical protein
MEIHLHDLHIELDEANERLLQIWDLHEKSNDSDYCADCLQTFPCATRKAFYLCECCGSN